MKMFSMTKLACVALLFGAVALSVAQGGGGGGRGQGMGRGMQQPDRTGVSLLVRADVQKDLGVTAEQKSALEKINQDMQEKRRAMMEEMRNGGTFDREAMQAATEKLMAETKTAVDKVLTDKQKTRLEEIRIQLAGNRVILEPEMQKKLNMTEEQIAQIKKLQDGMQQAMMALFEKMRNQEIEREEMQATMQKNNATMNTELGKVITPEQAEALKKMGGAPFKADPPQGRGGGGI